MFYVRKNIQVETGKGDPCQANTGNPAECVNTHGSFECSCLTGYRQSVGSMKVIICI